MKKSIKSKAIELFEKHRKTSGTYFDENYFLDFLMAKPEGKGAFRNSFLGLRRFNLFWDEAQLEFGICFSIKDRETNYTLTGFCERIAQLKNSKRSSKASLKNRMKYGFEWNIFIFANTVLISIALAISSYELILSAVILVIAYLNYKLISSYIKEKKYLEALESKILEK